MRWRRSAKHCSMSLAIAYWPGRCSKAREDLARRPPGWKKSCREGSFCSGVVEVVEIDVSGEAGGMR
jgi:hypothetical protein